MSYRELKSYQQAAAIYDLTVEFCDRFVDQTYRSDRADRAGGADRTYKTYPSYKSKSRMWDQMVQAARSGKQNIVEGTAVSKTSPQTEVRLLGVARGSLKELLEDYEDFLRQRGLAQWDKNDPRSLEVRGLCKSDRSDRPNRADRTDRFNKTNPTYETYRAYLDDPERAANLLVTLINQTTYLIDRQLGSVREQHENRGISFESREQKARRLLDEKGKREAALDQRLQAFLAKK